MNKITVTGPDETRKQRLTLLAKPSSDLPDRPTDQQLVRRKWATEMNPRVWGVWVRREERGLFAPSGGGVTSCSQTPPLLKEEPLFERKNWSWSRIGPENKIYSAGEDHNSLMDLPTDRQTDPKAQRRLTLLISLHGCSCPFSFLTYWWFGCSRAPCNYVVRYLKENKMSATPAQLTWDFHHFCAFCM